MKEKNEKKVKIISFAKKEEPSHHFGQIENGQMGQLEEVRPKVVHLKKGQSEVGQIENGQTSDRHQGVIIPKLFGQIKTCPNKIYQSKGGQSEDKRTEIEVGQIDKRKLDKLQKEVAKPTLFGQIQDGHNAIYRSEARQIEENENGQLVKGQSEIGHLGRCLPELKVVLKRLCFLSCSDCEFNFYLKSDLKLHREEEHPQDRGDPFRCRNRKCQKSFETGLHLVEHQIREHSESKCFEELDDKKYFLNCELCLAKFEFQESLDIHFENVHKLKGPEDSFEQLNDVDNHFEDLENHFEQFKSLEKDFEQLKEEDNYFGDDDDAADFLMPENNDSSHSEAESVSYNSETQRKRQKKSKNFHCNICKKAFFNGQYLSDHISFVHNGIKANKCEMCGKEFAYKSSMLNHFQYTKCFPLNVKIETSENLISSSSTRSRKIAVKKFACDICHKLFQRKQHLDDHISSFHEGVKAHQCEKCGQEFATKGNFLVHEKICDGSNKSDKLVCHICSKSFPNHQYLEDHISSIHERIKKHFCEICGMDFGFKHMMMQHCRKNNCLLKDNIDMEVEEGGHIFECDKCEGTFKRKQAFTDHVSFIHEKTKSYKCDKCEMLFAYKSCFQKHSLQQNCADSKEVKETFQCEFCPNLYLQRLSFKQHILTDHENHYTGETFNCEKCSKKFSAKSLLNQHLSLTHEKRDGVYQCEFCSKMFRQKFLLRKHVVTVHGTARSFTCEICHRTLKNTDRSQHKRIHLDNRQIQCDKCPKKFYLASVLKRHVQSVHDKLMTHSCDLCGKMFPQLQNLTKHVDNVHKKLRPFQCDICFGFYAQASSLNLHKKNVHKVILPKKYNIIVPNNSLIEKYEIPDTQ